MATTKKSGKGTTAKRRSSEIWTDEERAAMKEYAQEKKAAKKGGASKGDGEADVLAKIAAMADADRVTAERVHAIVKAAGPDLVSRTWYGMPAYAKDGKVVCFFQDAGKFKARYSTLGFQDAANLDDGPMWATSFAVREITPEAEAKITELVKKAVS